ncbi:hypothetical protein EDF56_102189 [Novosphingobium sp. PhB165]|uniref:hypothetical protein n=1 Tax=Novosphingobium sp. PhB165 TaxID=2485105 RepID=UPI00104C62A2|nr:hypothetical protein [Novosphingobium sp. PhB165]TCM20528.1 hypothetical protein EDF56_102189 [Novosphingobium sp. PhB165]
MIKTFGLVLPLLFVGPAVGPQYLADSPASMAMAPLALTQSASSLASFRMPTILKPAVKSADCPTIPTIRLGPGTPPLRKVCASNGRILVNGGNAQGFEISDVIAKNYGPVLRGVNVPGLQVLRVSATGARDDPKLGLGLVNVSNGIGHAVFRNLVWIGDPASPAINGDDAWAAIALKGKDANDLGTFEIRNFDFQNLIMAEGTHYRNVDGISTEKGYTGTIADGRVMNASDACLDLKGDVHVDNVYLAGCRQGLKIWHSQNHGLIELGTNRFAGILGKGTPSETRTINIDTLIVSGDPSIPLFRAEEGRVDLHIGRLIAKPNQVLRGSGSYAGSQVVVDRRINN